MRKPYRILVGKPQRKRLLGTPKRWERYIRMVLTEIRWEVVDWIHLSTGTNCGTCECCNEPSGSIKAGDFMTT
jgi:hypothetical protein